MTLIVFAFFLFLVFTFLGVLHLYWLFGGTWALDKAIPTKEEEKSNLKIPPLATLVVALGLFFLAFTYLEQANFTLKILPITIRRIVLWCIPVLFLIRAIGDFRYVGFFKKVKGTTFAVADTKLFSPLCLAIAFLGFTIVLLG